MIVDVDKEGRTLIEAVCDLALKTAGNQVFPIVQKIYAAMDNGGTVKEPLKVTGRGEVQEKE